MRLCLVSHWLQTVYGRGNSAANVFMMSFNRETSPSSVNTDGVILASVFAAKCFNLTSTEACPSIVHKVFNSMTAKLIFGISSKLG